MLDENEILSRQFFLLSLLFFFLRTSGRLTLGAPERLWHNNMYCVMDLGARLRAGMVLNPISTVLAGWKKDLSSFATNFFLSLLPLSPLSSPCRTRAFNYFFSVSPHCYELGMWPTFTLFVYQIYCARELQSKYDGSKRQKFLFSFFFSPEKAFIRVKKKFDDTR